LWNLQRQRQAMTETHINRSTETHIDSGSFRQVTLAYPPNLTYSSQLRLEQALFFANKQQIEQASVKKHTCEAKWAQIRDIGRSRGYLGAQVMIVFTKKYSFLTSARPKNTNRKFLGCQSSHWAAKRNFGCSCDRRIPRIRRVFLEGLFF
jgi:hypothetical protein